MSKARGIHEHRVFKLGKADPKTDKRNLLFQSVLRASAPTVPKSYDFDIAHPGIPTPMFANDMYGDCVIAGRAHQTLRFEKIEQGSILMIKDKTVLSEYFRESGGADSGLVVLDSLSEWRKKGWKIGKHTYKIQAYAQLAEGNHLEIRQAIYADIGIGIGVQLPLSAQKQIQTGQPWDVTSGPDAKPGSWGGHYVHVPGYNVHGPVCVTWGRKQQMTWKWFDKYCDEAYAIFDARDQFTFTCWPVIGFILECVWPRQCRQIRPIFRLFNTYALVVASFFIFRPPLYPQYCERLRVDSRRPCG